MLRLPPFRFLQPTTAREAALLLAEHGAEAMAVAGGTDLYPNLKRRQFEPKVLVSLRALPGTRGIEAGIGSRGEFRLGAMTTLTEVERHPEVLRRWPALARAAGLVSSPPLRNAGTIGGNLCVDTRCTYYNQTEFWRASIGYCMKRPAGGFSLGASAGFTPARAGCGMRAAAGRWPLGFSARR